MRIKKSIKAKRLYQLKKLENKFRKFLADYININRTEKASFYRFLELVYHLRISVSDVFGEESKEYESIFRLTLLDVTNGDSVVSDTKLKNICGMIIGELSGLINKYEIQRENKKYQFFISSTYRDLKKQRDIVARTIVNSENFYVGMEDFHAIAKGQLEYIKNNIKESDYYLLVIGANYGSIIKGSEISYTEFEFEIAKKYNKPILFFICNNREILSECDQKNQDKLNEFIEKVKEKATPCFFGSNEELEKELMYSINNILKDSPQRGWIRG